MKWTSYYRMKEKVRHLQPVNRAVPETYKKPLNLDSRSFDHLLIWARFITGICVMWPVDVAVLFSHILQVT